MTTTLAPSADVTEPPRKLPVAAPSESVKALHAPEMDVRRKALLRFAISITALTVIGHALLGFEQAPIVPVFCLVVSYTSSMILEYIDSWAHSRRAEFSGSAKNFFYFLLPPVGDALVAKMLDSLRPRDLGPGGTLLLYPTRGTAMHYDLLPPPPRDELFLVGFQRTVPIHDRLTLMRMQAANGAFADEARRIGGVAYAGPRPR